LTDEDASRSIDDASLFEQWHRDLSRDFGGFQEIILLELKARLLRLARSPVRTGADSATEGNRDSNRRSPNLEKAEIMACFIAREYRSGLRIKEIADVVDLHPDYAATLFRKTFGTTLISRITRHRVADAQRQLIATEEPVVDIAFASGFDSLSRFNKAFKEVAGMTPRKYRKECGAIPWKN